jgi:hypothetical protein
MPLQYEKRFSPRSSRVGTINLVVRTERSGSMRGQTENADQTRAESGRTILEAGGERPLVATVARWPLDVEDGFASRFLRDPWQSMVRDSIVAYREGRADVASWSWTGDIVWRISSNGSSEEHHGANRIFGFHQRLVRASGGTFRQRLVDLQGSQGPMVHATVHSSATRGPRQLDMPGMIVFEIGGSRIHSITELPGDPEAWTRFWAD